MSLLLLVACSDYGVESVRRFELFEQPGESVSADVLFVIDNSASMEEEQQRLGENFESFVGVLAETSADFQIGVVTTDTSGESAGYLTGPLLTPETPDLEAAFAAAVTVGTDGARDEQGLWASALAVDGRNPGLVRPESRLNVVYVSDEDDHSPAAVDSYLQTLRDRAGSGGFAAHALVGSLPAGCVSGTSAADPGGRYLQAADATAGYHDSICAESYAPLLTQVGLDAAGWNDTFVLEQLPQPDTIVVRVDAVVIPQRERDGWVYDAGDNAVVFDGRAVPRPGMTVDIEYVPWVGPEDEASSP